MRYFMLNKPKGYLSAARDERCKTVMELFSETDREGLFHVGRLDKDTEGLLVFTDDGKLCFDLLNPKNEIPKTYICYVTGELDFELVREVSGGVKIYENSETLTAPAKIELLESKTLYEIREYLSGRDIAFSRNKPSQKVSLVRVTLTEGKKHEVKRLMRYMGNRVLYLKRLAFASLALDENLPLGAYRHLTNAEIEALKAWQK